MLLILGHYLYPPSSSGLVYRRPLRLHAKECSHLYKNESTKSCPHHERRAWTNAEISILSTSYSELRSAPNQPLYALFRWSSGGLSSSYEHILSIPSAFRIPFLSRAWISPTLSIPGCTGLYSPMQI
ncbi:hypothetical protein N7508_002190 [Penicillium antarcticum]|uniref:uncharacterized protein n=1 Tax=Penicillium antarcticum TaxID=416450 RepID=UPI0023A3038E|nr:uncharacterized protein N7508_002190 [Penicillium antarcticum]KAJ5317682.1 hypothetical protein N7508_002190 [Penicillium antarcticum]